MTKPPSRPENSDTSPHSEIPSVECVRVDIDDIRQANRLKKDGWREIEILETWEGTPPKLFGMVECARPEDLPDLMEIAGNAFKYDRFHMDDKIPEEEADMFKQWWIQDALEDPKRIVVIARYKKPVGFLVLKDVKDKRAIIDLVAVDERFQGRGIARELICKAARAFNIDVMTAGTQESNEPARKLYEKLGFSIVKRQRTFHG